MLRDGYSFVNDQGYRLRTSYQLPACSLLSLQLANQVTLDLEMNTPPHPTLWVGTGTGMCCYYNNKISL